MRKQASLILFGLRGIRVLNFQEAYSWVLDFAATVFLLFYIG